MQKLFEAAWQELYPGLIEWVGLSDGGAPTAVDVATMTVMTDFDKFTGGVVNVIPPQKAGSAAELAGVADRTGWCPVDPLTFESRLQKDVHVIGDAAIAGAMPRSASAAHSQGAICAAAIAVLLAGRQPATPTLKSSCFSLIAPDYAISQSGTYRPADGQYVEAEPVIISAAGASRAVRADEAREAERLVPSHHQRDVRMMRWGLLALGLLAASGASARAQEALVPYRRGRRCDTDIADRQTRRSRERPRDGGQARDNVSALPRGSVSRSAFPGQSVAGSDRHGARAGPKESCGFAWSMPRASMRLRSCRRSIASTD